MFLAAVFCYLTGFGLLLSDFLRRMDFSYPWAVAGAVMVALSFCFLIGGMMQTQRLHEEARDSLP
jgi:hypothetical protein